jgi:hypothetical protein
MTIDVQIRDNRTQNIEAEIIPHLSFTLSHAKNLLDKDLTPSAIKEFLMDICFTPTTALFSPLFSFTSEN